MKKLYILLALAVVLPAWLYAQEEEPAKKVKSKPVYEFFASPTIIDQQTVYIPEAKTLEFVIEHRFGMIKDISDLYGIYGSTNVRLGFNYSILDNLSVGFGTTKNKMLQDFRVKYNILEQTRDGKMPLALTVYGNMAIDARAEENFGSNYEFTDRLSYFGELIVARKFTDWLSLQVSGQYAHQNAVIAGYEHDKFGVSASGRVKFTPQSSVIFNYGIPLHIESMQENIPLNIKPKDNFGIGWEIATATHVFQVFVSSSTALSPQYVLMENQNDWLDGDLFFGFTLTRKWGF